jgi:hypothetical protein
MVGAKSWSETYLKTKRKIKSKKANVFVTHNLKAYRVSEGTTPLILKFGTGWW